MPKVFLLRRGNITMTMLVESAMFIIVMLVSSFYSIKHKLLNRL